MPSVSTDWRCARTGELVAARVAKADDWWARSRGLLGRKSLENGEGLWIDPCRQVHTFFMKFSLDVVFLNTDMVVVGLARDLAPSRLTPIYFKARSALELAAGAASGLKRGDKLTMKRG